MSKALAYMRTSSATNVAGDSEVRQRTAIESGAERMGFKISKSDWFYDAAVSGADPLETRPGFMAMLDRIEGNGVRTIIVEDASRFARDMLTAELGIVMLQARGVTLLTASGDNLTETDDPMKVAMRQMAVTFSQLEKARLVAKLRAARQRKKARGEHAEGRPPVPAETIMLAKQLNDGTRTLRQIATDLEAAGHTVMLDGARSSKRYGASSIAGMLRK